MSKALSAVYRGRAVTPDGLSSREWERAIVAVWSQQYPKLHRQFRSVPSTCGLKSPAFGYADTGMNTGPVVKVRSVALDDLERLVAEGAVPADYLAARTGTPDAGPRTDGPTPR